METPIKREIVDGLVAELGIKDFIIRINQSC